MPLSRGKPKFYDSQESEPRKLGRIRFDPLQGGARTLPAVRRFAEGVQTLGSRGAETGVQSCILILNGRCATNANLLAMMQFQLERAFGRILGLDYSQVNPGSLASQNIDRKEGWPVMQPMSGVCGSGGGVCIPDPGTLRLDDIAALNRMYPITTANLGSFPGKVITAANTVSIDGNITFRAGMGMHVGGLRPRREIGRAHV